MNHILKYNRLPTFFATLIPEYMNNSSWLFPRTPQPPRRSRRRNRPRSSHQPRRRQPPRTRPRWRRRRRRRWRCPRMGRWRRWPRRRGRRGDQRDSFSQWCRHDRGNWGIGLKRFEISETKVWCCTRINFEYMCHGWCTCSSKMSFWISFFGGHDLIKTFRKK